MPTFFMNMPKGYAIIPTVFAVELIIVVFLPTVVGITVITYLRISSAC